MNIHPRTLKDGREVWRVEVFVDGTRRVRTVGPFAGNPKQQRRRAEEAWWKLRAEVEDHGASFVEPSTEKVGAFS